MPVTVTTHGGQCCGSRHLYSFDSIVNNGAFVDTINRALQVNVPVGRRVEVILNRRQVTQASSPALLRHLADLGFVLVEQYMNHNHNPARNNYVFTRCDTRRPLTDLPFEWTGQIISAGLTGNLPALPAPPPPVAGQFTAFEGAAVNPNLPIEFEDGTPATVRQVDAAGRIYPRAATRPNPVGTRHPHSSWQNGSSWYNPRCGSYGGSEGSNTILRIRNVANAFNVGDTVRVTNENSRYFNSSGRVLAVSATQVRVQMGVTREEVALAKISCTVITRVIQAPTVAPLPEMRHTQNDVVERVVNVPAAPEPVRVIYQTFHNRYQDGRIGAGYPTLAEAERAAPRARTRLRRDVSSDGTVNDVTL